jgi:hypothetical protein
MAKTSFSILLMIFLLSCKKETNTNIIAPPPSPVALLKDVVLSRLPSPYYHFEYDSSNKVSFISFASDLTRYHVIYEGGRIIELRNDILVNKDRLLYFYDNDGRVKAINYVDSMGVVYTKISLTYDGQELIKLERQKKQGIDFITDKEMTMTYYPDGNLFELSYHYFPVNGLTELIYKDRFEQYDNRINVDGFSLLHNEFFDHFVFLPGVRFQKNNPGRETRLGDVGDTQNYTVDYVYTFNNNNVPTLKEGVLIYLNGPDAGRHFNVSSIFSYY